MMRRAGLPGFWLLMLTLVLGAGYAGLQAQASDHKKVRVSKDESRIQASADESLRIDNAKWDVERNRLYVDGRSSRRATVVLADAASGETLSTVTADRRGQWRVRIYGLNETPCRVRASSNGSSVEKAVEHAPSDCSAPPPPPPPPPPSGGNLGELRVLAANDLGMHCADLDYQVFSILPPFNVLHAQVVERGQGGGEPRLLSDADVRLTYAASSSPLDPAGAGSINTTSGYTAGGVPKTNFWDLGAITGKTLAYDTYAVLYPYDSGVGDSILALFEPLPVDRGLPVPDINELLAGNLVPHQQDMPGSANTPQAFSRFDRDLAFFAGLTVQGQTIGKVIPGVNWFAADGIPILPVDDQGRSNAYPLMKVEARDKATDAVLAATDVVLPVASEADCQTCHAASDDGYSGLASDFAGVNTDADPGNDFMVMTEAQALADGLGPQYLLNAAKVNILRLHDAKHGTDLDNQRPVQCSQCHYSPALDLAQVGPVDDAAGRQQTTHISMSRAMHGHHGSLTFGGGDVFPQMPAPDDPARDQPANTVYPGADASLTVTEYVLQETCYQCHPGKQTQCLRGAMAAGGVVCQDCHGNMEQVGNDFTGQLSAANPAPDGLDLGKRIPWASEPACQSCHTGDAASPNHPAGAVVAPDGIRLLQAYILGEPDAKPIKVADSRFAENESLYRLSNGHGGVMCEGCHGSTHAIFPNPNPMANDNVTAKQLQGHSGTIIECDTCHEPGSLGITLDGPHGMHPVNDTRWVSNHEDLADDRPELCTTCHGTDGLGTVLSRTAAERTLPRKEGGGTVTLAKGTEVGCVECHENKITH